jgi:hypothetical protein
VIRFDPIKIKFAAFLISSFFCTKQTHLKLKKTKEHLNGISWWHFLMAFLDGISSSKELLEFVDGIWSKKKLLEFVDGIFDGICWWYILVAFLIEISG